MSRIQGILCGLKDYVEMRCGIPNMPLVLHEQDDILRRKAAYALSGWPATRYKRRHDIRRIPYCPDPADMRLQAAYEPDDIPYMPGCLIQRPGCGIHDIPNNPGFFHGYRNDRRSSPPRCACLACS